jgi:hypothetical protein
MFFELLLSSCYDVFENKPLLAFTFSKIKVFNLYVHTEMSTTKYLIKILE